MLPVQENRRRDTSLRQAIDRIQNELRSLDSHAKINKIILREILGLSSSPFGFVLVKKENGDGQAKMACISALGCEAEEQGYHGLSRQGEIVADAENRALFNALSFNRPLVLDQGSIRSLRDFNDTWPKLEQVLVIPLHDGKHPRCLVCLANAEAPYHTDFARRIWPLLTTYISLLRILENRQLESNTEKRLLLSQDEWRENFYRMESLSPVGMITLNGEKHIVRINPAAEAIFGVLASDILGQPITTLITQEHFVNALNASPRSQPYSGRESAISSVGYHRSGEYVPLEITMFHYDEYQQPRLLLYVVDSTDLVQAERRQQEELQRFRVLADLAPLGILQTSRDWHTEYVNERWREITGMSAEALHGLNWSRMLYYEDGEKVLANLHNYISVGKEFQTECRIQRQDGIFWVLFHAVPLFQPNGEVEGFLATLVDNSYQHESEERLRKLAESDVLTGLANRATFTDRLEHALSRVARHGALALLALDLDGFKNINDTLGHDAGDAMLIEVAKRLKSCVREEDTVSRVGGDEFFILLEGLSDATAAASVSEKILRALEQPFTISQQEVFISTSIGISFSVSGHACSVKSILKQADLALYRAKDAGRNNFQYYSPELEQASRRKLELGNSLHHALGRAEFEVYFQAQANVNSESLSGFEALLRWQHPLKGILPPSDFIGLLEETGLISPVSRWLFHMAFQHLRSWIDKGLVDDTYTMAVNISPQQFRDPTLVPNIEAAMRDAKLQGKHIVVEITETALVQEHTRTRQCLEQMREMGMRIALDDFGTGYSSLSYLKKFPIDIIKIDRSFIQDLLVDKDDAAITQAVIALAKSLKLKVLAEGVDKSEILKCLREWGCDEFQGYYLNQPMAATELVSLLEGAEIDSPRNLCG